MIYRRVLLYENVHVGSYPKILVLLSTFCTRVWGPKHRCMAIPLAQSAGLTVISLVLVRGTSQHLPFGPHHTVLALRLVFQATDQYSAAVVFACAQLMSLADMCCKLRLSRQPCMHDARIWTCQSFSLLQLFWTPDPSFCFDWISSVFTNSMENKYYCAQSFCFL